MATTDFLTAVRDPNAWLSQRLALKIPALKSGVSVLEFALKEALNEEYELEVLVASDDQTLDAADFLGKYATFVVEERAASRYLDTASRYARTLHGVITQWEHRSSSKDVAQFSLRIEPRVALLDRTKTSDVFLNKTLKEIFYDLLADRQRIWPHDIELKFEGHEHRYEQLLMYEESALEFIKRQCLLHGLYYYYKQADITSKTHRDTLVIDNRANGYMRSIDVPYVPPDGLSGQWHEGVLSIQCKQKLMPESIGLRDHNYRTPHAPVTAMAYVDRGDKTLYGSIDRSNEHFHTKDEANALARVRAEDIASRQIVHSGTSNIIGLYPGWVLKTINHKLPKAPYGLVITKITTTGSRTKPVTNSFEGTPSDKIWRPEYVPERDWRWMRGSVIATIESSRKDSPYADLDEHGRYLVRFHFHREPGSPGSNSMRLRLVQPSASRDGGFHAPLLPGTEVRVLFTNGDIDRGYIAGAVHDYSNRNHIHGYQGWNSRAVWRSPLLSGKLRFEDLQSKEGAKLATTYQKTSVSMGYLVDNQKKRRGEGFEVSSQGWGTIHGAKGLLLSADALSSPNAPHLEMQGALRELQLALGRVTALADATAQANAIAADKRTQSSLMDALDQLKSAGLIASAPGGIALTTPKSIQQAASENVIVTAGQHVDVSVVKRLTMAAGDLISLCANKLGLKIFAVKGKVEIQAQSGAMDLFGDKQVRLASASQDVQVSGKTKAVMASGGAAITVENGNVVFHIPGEFRIKAASFTFEGPENLETPLPILPRSELRITEQYPLTR